MWRASEVVIDYDLCCKSSAQERCDHEKRKLASVLGTFNLGETTTVEKGDDCIFRHDEADVTMVSFVLEAAKSGQSVFQILSDDTDVFILLVYWVYWEDLQCKV